MAKAAAKPKLTDSVGVYRDFNSRTCIKFSDDGSDVTFLPLDIEGFELRTLPVADFIQRYNPLPNYPMDRACSLYLTYAKTLGADREVLDQLSKFTDVQKEDYDMATSKRREKQTDTEVKKPTKVTKSEETKSEKTRKQPKETKPLVNTMLRKRAAPASTDGPKSAAQLFKELIMKGQLTDDQIFSQVQAAFGLDDNKRSYVGWYRNKLKKDGHNPPEPK